MRRNAWFNLGVLGAEVHEYLVDFYGPIDDAINAGDESDRLLVAWPTVDDGADRRREPTPSRPATVAVPTPDDIVVLRRTDPPRPTAWRHRLPRRARRAARRRRAASSASPATASTSCAGGAMTAPHRASCARSACRWSAPFQTSFGVQTSRRILLVRAEVDVDGVDDGGLGRVRRRRRADVLRRVRRRRRARDARPCWCPGSRAVDASRGRRRHRAGAGHAATRWPRRRWRWPCSTPSCAPPAARSPTCSASTRDRIPSGVSVGIHATIDDLLAAVAGYLDDGYVRIKLKIEPGWDLEPVAAVRDLIGPDVPLQVDANAAYTRQDAEHLAGSTSFDLLLIEQPLPEDDLLGHAALARAIDTPVCLDESITSRDRRRRRHRARRRRDRQHQGRPGRRVPRRRAASTTCAASRGIPVWCGGMLETGIGRAANAALAALDGFTLPGDISASRRF